MRSLRRADYPHVTVKVVDGATHGYVDRELQLFETIRNWLASDLTSPYCLLTILLTSDLRLLYVQSNVQRT